MEAKLTKAPQTVGDSYSVLDVTAETPAEKRKVRPMAQPPMRRTKKTGKTPSPTQGSKAEKPKIQVSTLQKKNPTDKRWG